jgi:hypothetical protein
MTTDPLLTRARELWLELASVPVSFPPTGGLRVVPAPASGRCPPGWVGVVALEGSAIATAPDPDAAAFVRAAPATLPVTALTDTDAVRAVLPVDRVRRVTVEELDPAGPAPQHLATLLGGYGSTRAAPALHAMLRAEHGPAVRRYLARVDGRPAAAASLFLHPDGALLSGAATLPGYRRNGCQQALIARRLADAAALTDLAVVTVAFGSASHGNLERVGFRQTHTRTAWRPLHPIPPITDSDRRGDGEAVGSRE